MYHVPPPPAIVGTAEACPEKDDEMPRQIAVTQHDIVKRARSVVGEGKYMLGAGGRDPNAPHPFTTGLSDCSGFVAWCLGLDRYQPGRIDGEWIETTAVAHDACFTKKMFHGVDVPQPGDVIVYGDRDGHQGHIGIVSEVDRGRVVRVVHCSKGNWRVKGAACAETGPEAFNLHGAIVARFNDAKPEPGPSAHCEIP